MSAIATGRSHVLSRHAAAPHYPWNVAVQNGNAWSRFPASPFADGLILMPNHPEREHVAVTYGRIELRAPVDTFALLFGITSASKHSHAIRVAVSLADDSGATVEDETVLADGERGAVTLKFGALDRETVRLRLEASFHHFEPGDDYGVIRLVYALAYEGNVLVDLLNASGSDKGTTHWWGRGVPHCYALEYHRLFEPFRLERFALLEVGVGNTIPPADAPSLRAWREYFPNATLYGYDIEDFSFFSQRDTVVFRGDQSSRDDLRGFLESVDPPPFRVVIDDGSHASSHQQISLATLFRHVEPGGLYVVEDLSWQPFEETPTTADVLLRFIERGAIESSFVTDAEARYLEEAIDEVTIFRPNDSEFALIKKKSM